MRPVCFGHAQRPCGRVTRLTWPFHACYKNRPSTTRAPDRAQHVIRAHPMRPGKPGKGPWRNRPTGQEHAELRRRPRFHQKRGPLVNKQELIDLVAKSADISKAAAGRWRLARWPSGWRFTWLHRRRARRERRWCPGGAFHADRACDSAASPAASAGRGADRAGAATSDADPIARAYR